MPIPTRRQVSCQFAFHYSFATVRLPSRLPPAFFSVDACWRGQEAPRSLTSAPSRRRRSEPASRSATLPASSGPAGASSARSLPPQPRVDCRPLPSAR